MKKRILFSLCVLSCLIFGLPGCGSEKTKQQSSLEKVAAITTGAPQTQRFEAAGIIRAAGAINVFFLVAGTLEAGEVPLKPGTRFKKGQLLYTINNRSAYTQFRAQQKQLVQSVQGALPEIARLFPAELNKWNSFAQAIGPTQLLPAFPSPASTDETAFILKTGLRKEYTSALLLETAMKNYFYVAPFDGVFLETLIIPGKTVHQYAPVAAIARSLHYEIDISTDQQHHFIAARTTSIAIHDLKGTRIGTGNLVPAAAPLKYRSNFRPEKGAVVKHGQIVNVIATEQQAVSFTALPKTAVNGKTVLVFRDGKAVSQSVTIYAATGDSIFVAPLAAGMRIIEQYDGSLAGKKVGVKE